MLHALSESENQEPATSSSIEAVSEEPTYRIGDHIAAFSVLTLVSVNGFLVLLRISYPQIYYQFIYDEDGKQWSKLGVSRGVGNPQH